MITAFVVVMSIVATCPVALAAQGVDNPITPQASDTIASYSANITVPSSALRVNFTITGTRTMDEIGSTKIVLKESTNNSTWTTVKTYYPSSYSSMLKHNTVYCSSAVSYSSYVSGRYYKAVVTVKAERDGVSDSRTITTSVKKA